MKMSINLFIAILFSFSMSSATFTQETKTESDSIAVKTVAISVPTLICATCVKTITKALKSTEGVDEVVVDKKTKIATVKFQNQIDR